MTESDWSKAEKHLERRDHGRVAMTNPIYIALLGIAVMSLWGGIWPIGVLLVSMAACMEDT